MEPLLVLVPVLDRPQNVAPLVASHKFSGTPGRLLFLVNPDDTAELQAIQDAGASYMTVTAVTWPEKINEGFKYARTVADWALFGADDVTFHEGWWDATAALRAQPEINVIGTNDLGNPAVIAGDHATHPLVRTSYLGTVDDPDKIVHDGYKHSFVDNEFVTTAKIRGCWAACPGAVIEHNHPFWGKTHWDDTYGKGQATLDADGALWQFDRVPRLIRYAKSLGLEIL